MHKFLWNFQKEKQKEHSKNKIWITSDTGKLQKNLHDCQQKSAIQENILQEAKSRLKY